MTAVAPVARRLPGAPSMWFFVIGDLLIFGAYFVAYMFYRGQDHALFLHSQARLNLDIGAINTIVLITSSLFVALGTSAARAGNRRRPSDRSVWDWLSVRPSRSSNCSNTCPRFSGA